jgi:hypothetical protein
MMRKGQASGPGELDHESDHAPERELLGRGLLWLAALVVFAVALMFACGAAAADSDDALRGLRALVGDQETEFLLTELGRIQPPQRIRRLARYQAFQVWLGGGFHGLLPNQLVDPQAIPIPEDEAGLLRAAGALAMQRKANREALARLEMPVRHWDRGFLPASKPPPSSGLQLVIDWSVVRGFLDASEDGEVTIEEARSIAGLPANREMISAFNRASPPTDPRLTVESLAVLIAGAGSRDPLDRLWCWLNPVNQLGYADIVMNEDRYRMMVADFDLHAEEIRNTVLERVSLVARSGVDMDLSFALTFCGLVQDWETNEMIGTNVVQFKDGWDLLTAAIAERVVRRLLPQLCRSVAEGPRDSYADLVCSGLADERYDGLFELISTTVLEGVVHLAGCPTCQVTEAPRAALGVEYIERFIQEVVVDCHVVAADEYLCGGMCEKGPLYHLGRYLARTVVDHDGAGALGSLLQKSPIAVLDRVWEIESERGSGVLSEEMMSALGGLSVRLERDSNPLARLEVVD